MWNCTHFRHPTDEQLGHVDIFFCNCYNLQSVYFELNTLYKLNYKAKITRPEVAVLASSKRGRTVKKP